MALGVPILKHFRVSAIAEFAHSINLEEVAEYKPLSLDLHCLLF